MKKESVIHRLSKNMILFGKVTMPNMFSSESPAFHYEIAEHLIDVNDKQIKEMEK